MSTLRTEPMSRFLGRAASGPGCVTEMATEPLFARTIPGRKATDTRSTTAAANGLFGIANSKSEPIKGECPMSGALPGSAWA